MAKTASFNDSSKLLAASLKENEIERLRGPTENDWSWNCRLKFISYHVHHSAYSLQVLNCYSWTLINSKTLGCRYDPEHMAALHLMASAAGIDEDLLNGGPTPQIVAKNVTGVRGKGRGNAQNSERSKDNSIVHENASASTSWSNKSPVAKNGTPNWTEQNLEMKQFTALLGSIAPSARIIPATQAQPVTPRPFFTSTQQDSADLDKEVEQLTSVVERNEKDALLKETEVYFDASMISVPAPPGEMLLRPSASRIVEHPSLITLASPTNVSRREQQNSTKPVSPLLDELELKRICDIVGPQSSSKLVPASDATRSEASSVEVFRNSDGQVTATGGVLHVSQDTLLAMKARAPRNALLTGLLSQAQNEIQATVPVSNEQDPWEAMSKLAEEDAVLSGKNKNGPVQPCLRNEPRDRVAANHRSQVSKQSRSYVPVGSSSFSKALRLLPGKRQAMTEFVRDKAFVDAVKFLKSRPTMELVIRLTGDLTEIDAARSLQETIDANRATSFLSICCEEIASGRHLHRCKLIYARTVLLTVEGSSVKSAKSALAYKGLKALMQRFVTVKIAASESAFMQPVGRNDLLTGQATDRVLAAVDAAVSSQEMVSRKESFGLKILTKHGWANGKGLGRSESGSSQPISYNSQMTSYASHGKRGLGYRDEGVERILIADQSEKLFQCYLANAVLLKDLVFSNEFSSAERDVIHHVAEKYSLSHCSLGSGESRHLVVRCKFNLHQLVQELRRVGGVTGRYSLIEPAAEFL